MCSNETPFISSSSVKLCLKAMGHYFHKIKVSQSWQSYYQIHSGSLLRPDGSECGHHAHGPEPHAGHPGRVDPRQHGHARQVQTQDQAGGPGDLLY